MKPSGLREKQKSSEKNLYNVIISSKKRRECSAREENLRLKLERLNEDHKRLKEVMVSTIHPAPCPLPHPKKYIKKLSLASIGIDMNKLIMRKK